MISEENNKIWTIFDKREEKLLRRNLSDFDFSKYSKKQISDLVVFMRKMMVLYKGVGLSANQIGLDMKVFVAQEPDREGGGYKVKFYAVFNPAVISYSKGKFSEDEGCLSIPGYYGETERYEKIEIEGFDKNQRKIKIKANGYLARIFQHEIDHLNGKLFIDRAKKVFKVESI